MNRSFIFLILFVVIIIGITSSIFVVDEREKALVLQFGQVKSVKTEPGIKFKVPLIQNVVRYDDRILSLDTMPLEVTPLDGRRLVVDAFARYRIVDVVVFRKAVGTGGTASAEVRLERILNAALREVLGSVTSNAVTSADRVELMTRIRDAAITEAEGLGVEIVDVRIKRADLPTQNLAATFQRMQAERERMAADERARQMGATGAGIELLTQLAANLGKKDVFEEEEEVDITDIPTNTNQSAGMGMGSSSGLAAE